MNDKLDASPSTLPQTNYSTLEHNDETTTHRWTKPNKHHYWQERRFFMPRGSTSQSQSISSKSSPIHSIRRIHYPVKPRIASVSVVRVCIHAHNSYFYYCRSSCYSFYSHYTCTGWLWNVGSHSRSFEDPRVMNMWYVAGFAIHSLATKIGYSVCSSNAIFALYWPPLK